MTVFKPELTATWGTNADAFPKILKVYARPGDTIADVTYGRGVFWRKVDKSLYNVLESDLVFNGIDFTNLPYEESSIDMLVRSAVYDRRAWRKRKHTDLLPERQC
jgi:hypothetical protein